MNPVPYENILIGYFLYSLGFTVSKNGYDISKFTPNLLQQTPLDRELGDLLINSASKYLIIEFKRTIHEIRSEITKKGDLIDCLQKHHIYDLSSKCHYLAIGNTLDEIIELQFMSYFDGLLKFDKSYTSEKFIDKLLKNNIGVDKQQFQMYLQYIKDCRPFDPSKCANCLLIEIDKQGTIASYFFSEFSNEYEIGS